MANTTNFGWETPDDTDLVKDGAAAMRTLGNAIDASLVDLKGGTSGQVLSKNSNTDMDFTWVTTNDADAIQNSIVDAKGDLITASAADTPARLAVGNNGETLVADSSATTGLRWQSPKTINYCLNSAMNIWQRGTSFTVSSGSLTYYSADRWQAYRNATGATVSRQTTSDTTNLPFIQYAARVSRDSGNSSTAAIFLAQSLESSQSYPLVGRTVVFSFYARAGANYSATSSALAFAVRTGTGTDQNILNGFTGVASPINGTATLTTTWQRFQATATLSSTATQVGFDFSFTPVGTAGANDWFEVTGVQLEVGSIATPFQTATGTLAGELAACQRYYYRNTAVTGEGVLPTYSTVGTGFAKSTTKAAIFVPLPVTMRVAPTSTLDYANLLLTDQVSEISLTNLTISATNKQWAELEATVASGLTQYRPYELGGGGSLPYVGFTAEL